MQSKFLTHTVNLILLFFLSSMNAEISIINLNGMTSSVKKPNIGVKQKYVDLSPAVGALFWNSPLLKNIYEYGPAQEAFTKLIKELFHVHVDGSFDATRLPTKIAFYFDPMTIGQLVSMIYQAKNSQTFDSKAFAETISKNLIDPLVKRKEPVIRQAFVDNYTKAITRFNYDINRIKEKISEEKDEQIKADLLKQSVKRKAAADTYAGLLKKIKNPQAPIKDQMFTKSINEFGNLIANVVEQEASGSYPQGLTSCSLLAVLWKKAAVKADLNDYLNSVAQNLSIQADELYYWPDKQKEYTLADYMVLKNLPAKAIESLSLDDLIFARFAYNLFDNPLPPEVEMIGNTHYKGKEFSDCGETSLRNVINALSYDHTNRKFDLAILKTLSTGNSNPALLEFYTRFATATKIKENAAHDAWADIVSNLPNVKYSAGTHDIDEGFSNMMHVITALFPEIHTLQDLATKLKQKHNIKITIDSKFPIEGPNIKNVNNDITLTIQKPGTNPFDIVWQFTPGHFELKFPEPEKIPYAQNFIAALSYSKEDLSLVQACLLASFITDYKNLKTNTILSKGGIKKFVLPLNSNKEKINTASFIASLENPSESEKLFVAKLSKSLPRDYYILKDFFDTIVDANPSLAEFVIQQQTDTHGISVGIDAVLTHSVDTLYDWAAKPEHEQIICSEDPSYFLETLIQTPFSEANENKQRLLLKLYSWAEKPQTIAHIKPGDDSTNIILILLENPQQKEFGLKLYDWALAQDFTQFALDSYLITTILNTPIPQDTEGIKKKELLLKLYDWALSQDLTQFKLDSYLITTILNTPIPQDTEDIKKKELLLKLYDWALSQDFTQNLELDSYLMDAILNTPYPEEAEAFKKKNLLLKLYDWALLQDFSQKLELEPYLINSILITPFPETESTQKKELWVKLYNWALAQDFKNLEHEAYLLGQILFTAIPEGKGFKKEKKLLEKFYDWALARDFSQGLKLDFNLVMGMLHPKLPLEPKKQALLTKLYDWTLSKNISQELDLNAALIVQLLQAEIPQKKEGKNEKEFLLKLYNWVLVKDFKDLKYDPYLITTLFYREIPEGKAALKKRNLFLKLYNWLATQDLYFTPDQSELTSLFEALVNPYPYLLARIPDVKKRFLDKLYAWALRSDTLAKLDPALRNRLKEKIKTILPIADQFPDKPEFKKFMETLLGKVQAEE